MTLMARHQRLINASKLVKLAALEVHDALGDAGHPALEKLSGELATMGAVTECIAYSFKDIDNEQSQGKIRVV